MPIVPSDIEFRYSVKTGSAGDTTAQGDPNASLGKYVSTSVITSASAENLFDDVTGAENAAEVVFYRCLFVLNDHATITLESAKAWISQEYAGGVVMAIGLDPAGVVAKGSASAQAAEITDEQTAPAGVSFSSPTTKETGLSIGNIPAGSVQAIWVAMTATNSAALALDGGSIKVEGDTAAA